MNWPLTPALSPITPFFKSARLAGRGRYKCRAEQYWASPPTDAYSEFVAFRGGEGES
jgi:hypothetical protein